MEMQNEKGVPMDRCEYKIYDVLNWDVKLKSTQSTDGMESIEAIYAQYTSPKNEIFIIL